jgi:hypothetical protein
LRLAVVQFEVAQTRPQRTSPSCLRFAGEIKSPAEAGLPQCVLLLSAEHAGRVKHTSGRKQAEGDQSQIHNRSSMEKFRVRRRQRRAKPDTTPVEPGLEFESRDYCGPDLLCRS